MTLSQILDNKNNFKTDEKSIGYCLGNFPKQCSDALFLGRNLSIDLPKTVDCVFLCGVGGSALAGEFVKNIALHYGKIPIMVVRNYMLPPFATKNSLAVVISYSGNTEEALGCYDHAKEIGCSIVAVCSEGRLKERGEKDHCTMIDVPLGFQPRMATLHLALPILLMLANEKLVDLPHEEITEIYFNLGNLARKWGLDTPAVRNRAKATALLLYGKTPILWGSEGLTDVAAKNMKCQLNETAEMPCFCGSIPEVNHNEIMAFQKTKSNFALVLFRDQYEHPRVARRFEITKTLLWDKVGKFVEFRGSGKSVLSRMAEGVYFGDLVGYYLSVLNNVNPEDIAMISKFKSRMSR